MYEDHTAFIARIADTSASLQEFLDLGQVSRSMTKVKVLGMHATCGRGYSTENGSAVAGNSSGTCTPCEFGFHKEALDDSPCLQCPTFASTNSTGTTDGALCFCEDGYMLINGSSACVSKSQYVSVEDAKAAARAVSSIVGAVVGANVAVTVGTVVASSVSSAVAASSGGAVGGGAASGGAGAGGSSGGSSSSSTITLITQVQFLNQVGRIGETRQENNRQALSLVVHACLIVILCFFPDLSH